MQAMRNLIERLQGEIKFDKTTIAALNFEIARLKRWRFGQSSESLDTQVALFDQIVADTQAEDTAAQDEQQGPAADLTPKSAVWFDFCKGRGGEHPRRVLKDYAGTMVLTHGVNSDTICYGVAREAACTT